MTSDQTLKLVLIQPSAGPRKVRVRGCARQRCLLRRTLAPRAPADRRRPPLHRMQAVGMAHTGRSRRWSARSARASG